MARKHPLARWFQTHTVAQGAELCKLAKTSRPYLRHVCAGRRSLSLELKCELEVAAAHIDGECTLKLGGLDACDSYVARLVKYRPRS